MSTDERPVAVFVMAEAFTDDVFGEHEHERLETMCRVPDRVPLADFNDERAPDLLSEARVIITGWGAPRIGSRALALAPRLELVAHAAGTVKDIVTDSFWAAGVTLVSAAAANAIPVAEYTLAAILLANKRAFRLQRLYSERRTWAHWPSEMPDMGNRHKIVGIVGLSRVGRRVVELLQPFDLEVIVYDPFVDDRLAADLGATKVTLDRLLATADVVSLHAPSLPETHHMLDRGRLAQIRDGAVLINTARGALVDTGALTDELVSGRIDAVIDVTDPEVLPADSPLYDLDNVFLTPHIAGATSLETRRLADVALDEIERFLLDCPLEHQVTQDQLDRLA